MHDQHGDNSTLESLQQRLGIRFNQPDLLLQSMTHRSFANESNQADVQDNERLEFLGDAVLNFLSGELVYRQFPDGPEGKLTRLRAALVRTESLRELALQCDLGPVLRMGKGEENSGGRMRKSNLCAAFEALVGAVYLDKGLETVRQFVVPLLEMRLEVVISESLYQDARTLLQEWSQLQHGFTPVYETVDETGPEHEKIYHVRVAITEDVIGLGDGRSKRAAAQSAARDALKKLTQKYPDIDISRGVL